MTRSRTIPLVMLLALALATPLALAQTPSPPPSTPPAADTTRAQAPAAPDTARALVTAPAAPDTTRAAAPDTTRARPSAPAAADTSRARAAATTPAPAPAATPPPSPVSGIRNKISAGDLLSAESILEVHREKYGENGPYLVGLSWLARGAMLLGDLEKARRYVGDVRARCDRKRVAGDTLERDRDFETALGAAIEVEAQIIEKSKGPGAAAAFVRAELPRIKGPVSLRSRLYKRVNMMTLVGEKAPALAPDDSLGGPAPALAGQPTLMFMWAEWCADCKAQAASLSRIRKRFEPEGLRLLAVTRYYDAESLRVREKARVDSVWRADYPDLAGVPVILSTASMERYGASSTPTFVFVDRVGVVRRYTPTRLTEAEMARTLTGLVKPSP